MDDKLKQQAAQQAPPVGSPQILSETVRDLRKEVKEEPLDNAQARRRKILDRLSVSDEWVVLKEHLEFKIHRLRRNFNEHLASGKIDLQDVGIRSLIVNEVGNAFQEVIDLVELSKKKVSIPPSEKDDTYETVGLQEEVK